MAQLQALEAAIAELEERLSALDGGATSSATSTPTLFDEVFDIVGNSATILPLVGAEDDPDPTLITFTTRRATATGLEATFIWSEAPSAFDTPLGLNDPANLQEVAPVVTFNGTDEEADSLDADYWTRGDGVNDSPFSIGVWLNITPTAGTRIVLAKMDVDSAAAEWRLMLTGGNNLQMRLADNSNGNEARATTHGPVPVAQWVFVVATYDGAGGASAADTITLYLDGVAAGRTASTDGSYTAMEDTSAKVMIAHQVSGGAANLFRGKMAGGAMGPFFTLTQLSASEVNDLYNLGLTTLGLD